MVTQGVRVMVSTDWLVLGEGHSIINLVLMSAIELFGLPLQGFVLWDHYASVGPELKHT